VLQLGAETIARLVDDEKFPALEADEYRNLLPAIEEAL